MSISGPDSPKRVVSGVQIVRCCLVCVADIIKANLYFRRRDGPPPLLLMRIDSVDNPNQMLTTIESQTAELSAFSFLETNNRDPSDYVIGIYVDLTQESTRQN